VPTPLTFVPAVSNAIAIVESIGGRRAATMSTLQQTLGISQASVYRIVQTLLGSRWLRKCETTGKLEIGERLREIAGAAGSYASLCETLAPLLAALRDATGLTVKASVREGDEYVMIARAESHRPMSITARVGARESLCRGSAGAVLLSSLPDERIEDIFRSAPKDVWAHQTPADVLCRVAVARKSGMYRDLGQTHPQIAVVSILLPATDHTSDAAITIIGWPVDLVGKDLHAAECGLMEVRNKALAKINI